MAAYHVLKKSPSAVNSLIAELYPLQFCLICISLSVELKACEENI